MDKEKKRILNRNYRQKHKEKLNIARKEWRLNNPEKEKLYHRKYYDKQPPGHRKLKDRRRYLRRVYNISLEDFDDMVIAQGGMCAICKLTHEMAIERDKEPFHVDHDPHETGAVRGLLCSFCNTGLGMFKDNSDSLQVAISYLLKFRN